MGSSSFLPLSQNQFRIPQTKFAVCEPHKITQVAFSKKPTTPSPSSPSYSLSCQVLHRCVPFAASVSILLCSGPAKAGFLSGFPGLESVPGPKLPEIEFLNRFNEENQKKYAEDDARFKSSPLLKKLLEQSKLNKEKNRQEIQDKYCLRGAEWGVGDCSAEAMSPEDREKFISMLKQKAGLSE
ncbi:hypothetical protein HS088_TW22G00848 [Tripterygium wilfordii]|uniref:Uncharacterized protein n=1 Tax=Tripterygium wilfordii TaxID=458696 RepID=A0A7J7BZ67_TRIWF|nr:uncharacterized protein LOC119992246 [Tripterygium wilfordii]KAF5727161.1 hypothetical protein HS088_TW22G00848 [Tripterygium wilfordii]